MTLSDREWRTVTMGDSLLTRLATRPQPSRTSPTYFADARNIVMARELVRLRERVASQEAELEQARAALALICACLPDGYCGEQPPARPLRVA